MDNRIIVPGEILLANVSEQLGNGLDVCMRVKGSSMLPFITGDRDSVIMRKLDKVGVGDIVLARIRKGTYVVHRIIDIDGDMVRLMGDGNIAGTETCRLSDICGTILWVEDPHGKRKDCRSKTHFRKAAIWRKLLPVRRILLAIYRRTILKLKTK